MPPLEEELFKDGFAFVARHFPRRSLHDNAVLTYFYARRRIGVAVPGPGLRLKDPLPAHAEETLSVFRNLIHFVAAKRDSVNNPNQPLMPEGHPDGGQWTAEGGGGSGSSSHLGSESEANPMAAVRAAMRCPSNRLLHTIGRADGSGMRSGPGLAPRAALP